MRADPSSVVLVSDRVAEKVAIVGTAPSSRMLAPFGDAAWEIWGVSNLYQHIPKWDRWFEIHDLETRKNEQEHPGHYQWLKQQTRPIYMQRQHPEIPGSIEYPLHEMKQRFGSYFTNSVSYMLALAVHQGAKEIGLWGVDMACHGVGGQSEYAHQRPSCEYFIGFARGLGIIVTVPDESDLLKTAGMYGYETAGAMALKLRLRRKELEARAQAAEGRLEAAKQEFCFLKGAIDDMNYMGNWV